MLVENNLVEHRCRTYVLRWFNGHCALQLKCHMMWLLCLWCWFDKNWKCCFRKDARTESSMSLHIEFRVAAHLIGSPDYHSSVCLLRSNIFAKFSLSRPGIRKNICCRHTLFGEIAAKRSVLLCKIFFCTIWCNLFCDGISTPKECVSCNIDCDAFNDVRSCSHHSIIVNKWPFKMKWSIHIRKYFLKKTYLIFGKYIWENPLLENLIPSTKPAASMIFQWQKPLQRLRPQSAFFLYLFFHHWIKIFSVVYNEMHQTNQ